MEFMTSDQLGPEVNVDALRDFTNLNGGYGFGLSVAVRRRLGVAGILGFPAESNWGGAGGTYFWTQRRTNRRPDGLCVAASARPYAAAVNRDTGICPSLGELI
ncbi:MAG TPA: hypothetical protein VN901_29680 [Candidatus Acidoferrales bacterium]|nr:hypothetical protein [Candidatus Acidoferrales bacterium]